MKRMGLVMALMTAALPLSCVASATGGYSIEVLVDGRPVQEYYYRGKGYVEALEGREYSVRISNPTPSRVAVALAVDGLNSIDAKHTAARQAAKWVLDPYQAVTIDGWQTSGATARRFFFTTESHSYANWIGDTRNVGLISAVFFREKRYPVTRYYQDREERSRAPSAAPAPSGGLGESDGKASPDASGESGRIAPPVPQKDDMAATGIGRELDHRVTRVHFDLEDMPAASIDIRYEYRPELVRLGILPEWHRCPPTPLDRRDGARGFEDGGFAPDPYR
ncbi:MAG: hypothetical protein HYX75_11640 [Acidobacteria bacterium]|nr:hypothetical protein [Acidobacteriota bacterium]